MNPTLSMLNMEKRELQVELDALNKCQEQVELSIANYQNKIDLLVEERKKRAAVVLHVEELLLQKQYEIDQAKHHINIDSEGGSVAPYGKIKR